MTKQAKLDQRLVTRSKLMTKIKNFFEGVFFVFWLLLMWIFKVDI
jgi:hypothetical protein